MTYSKRFSSRKAKWTLQVAGLGILCLLLCSLVISEGVLPYRFDLEYYLRLRILRSHIKRNPKKEVIVFLGTSRTLGALNAKLASEQTDSIVFNFSMSGNTLQTEWLMLDRLVQDQPKIDHIFFELIPNSLCSSIKPSELSNFLAKERLGYRDYQNLSKLGDTWSKLKWAYYRTLLVRPFELRLAWQDLLVRYWNPAYATLSQQYQFDSYGFSPAADELLRNTPGLLDQLHENTMRVYVQNYQQFTILDENKDVVERVRQTAAKAGIPLHFYVTPEASWLRDALSKQAKAELLAYLQSIGSQHIAWEWLTDEQFFDGHHLYQSTTEQFTKQVLNHWLLPLVQSQ